MITVKKNDIGHFGRYSAFNAFIAHATFLKLYIQYILRLLPSAK